MTDVFLLTKHLAALMSIIVSINSIKCSYFFVHPPALLCVCERASPCCTPPPRVRKFPAINNVVAKQDNTACRNEALLPGFDTGQTCPLQLGEDSLNVELYTLLLNMKDFCSSDTMKFSLLGWVTSMWVCTQKWLIDTRGGVTHVNHNNTGLPSYVPVC